MELTKILPGVDLFQGLTEDQLVKVAAICTEKRYQANQLIAQQGEPGDSLFVVTQGFVEVLVSSDHPADTDTSGGQRVVVNLGSGQIIGEMSLLDQGPRSASIRAVSNPTVLQMICREDFDSLCQEDTHIGYVVMRNLAVDLSFKLRHRNLSER